ncbi:MAG: hypothetical protein ACI4LJ_07045 [Anaerovoracaceae bacterium]
MLKRKLRSESGVTLLMALLFFLLCALGSSVVLAAGSTASGRIAGLEQDQQAFYTVTSAAQVLQEEINGTSFAGKQETPGEKSITIPVSGSLSNLMNTAVESVYINGVPYEDTLTIRPQSIDTFGTVKASFTMDKDYNISIALSLSDANLADKYQCVVTAKGNSHITAVTETRNDSKGKDYTVLITTTDITWSDALIKKNVPSEL